MTDFPRARHRALAATLSFLFPGLGHAYAGRPRLALVLAVPVLALLAAGLVLVVGFDRTFRNLLFTETFLAALLGVNLALMAWRLLAIGHVGLARPVRRTAARTLAAVAVLAVATIAMHAYAGLVITRLDAALDQIFNEPISRGGGPVRTTPPEPGSTPPPEYHWDGTEPINFLLVGVDAAPGRDHALADTIIVVSVDPIAHDAVMVSIPRDTGYVPLPDTRLFADARYPNKINELASQARDAQETWCPDLEPAADCGTRVLRESVSLYLGVPIHYYAELDLNGFADLIDAVGGVELCLPGELVDPHYVDSRSGERGIVLPAGCERYDGRRALAYARIRQGTMVMPDGEVLPQNDFRRAERQQQVLLGLRTELAEADLLFELPGLLDAIARTVQSDFPRDQAGDLASLVPLVTGPAIERVVLGTPEFVDPPVDPEGNYLLIPRRDAIRAEAERIFGHRGQLQGWYVGSHDAVPVDNEGGTQDEEDPQAQDPGGVAP